MRAVLLVLLLFTSGSLFSQAFPMRTMRIIVPSPAGSSPDIRARQIAPKLSEALGQPVIVDNRPGGAGLVAAREAAKAPAEDRKSVV